MNLELWNEAVDWIEDHPDEYDQECSGVRLLQGATLPTECKTPCCFLGIVGMLLKEPFEARTNDDEEDFTEQCEGGLIDLASVKLDITEEEAGALFVQVWPWSWFLRAGFTFPVPVLYEIPTAAQAVAILRSMASDGRVWEAGE